MDYKATTDSGPGEVRARATLLAKRLLLRRNEGVPITGEDVLSVLRHWSFHKNPDRPNVTPDGADKVLSETFGLIHAHHKVDPTVATRGCQYPQVTQLLNLWLRGQMGLIDTGAPRGCHRAQIHTLVLVQHHP